MSDTATVTAAPLDPLVQRYLDHVQFEKRLAQRTLILYTLDLQKLCASAAAADVALMQVQSSHIRRWVAQMHGAGRSGRGIGLILSGWRGFYAWLGQAGLVVCNPVQGVRAPRAAKPLPKALSVDEAVQLAGFQAEAANPWLELRDAAMVELLYDGGLRLGELTGLDVQASSTAQGWVDLQAAEAHVLGKGSKRRIVPVGPKAVQALQAWLAVRSQLRPGPGLLPDTAASARPELPPNHSVQSTPASGQSALFIGQRGTRLTSQAIWQRLRSRSLQAGLTQPVHPHMLRHSFASHLLQSSSDLRGVQELLGHANISSTQVYTRLDFGHLAKTYDAAHPRAHLKPGGSK
jgi:integrase/recombinase XerC